MAGFTDYGENLVLTWAFTASAATRPTAWYTALHLNSSPPTETTPATGEIGSSVGYSRQSTTWTVSGTTQIANSGTLTFGPNTTTNWGTLGYASIWDASTSGNCLAFGALSSTVAIAVNDSLQIAASALVMTLD